MDPFTTLQSFGLALPTPAYLLGAVLFSLIGYAVYRHGKKAGHARRKWLGVGLMLYAYVVPQTWLLYAIGVALCAVVFMDRG